MKEFAVWVSGVVLLVAILIGLFVGVPWLRLQAMRLYGTEIESAKTDIYMQNKGFVEGTRRELRELHVDYVKANESQKEALASLILHRAGELDPERLPKDIREFLQDIKEKHQ